MAKVPQQITSPISWKTPIVNPDGTMTEPMRRLVQALTANGGTSTDVVQQLIDAELQAGSGISITPDGHLLSNPTIAAEVQPILDQITDVHGSILYRDGTAWAHLPPGTIGQVLQTNGAGADPTWETPTSGSGDYVLIESYTADGSTGTKTFSGISSTYAELEVVLWGRGTNASAQGVAVTVNSLGASGYDLQRQYATGTTNTADQTLAGSSWASVLNLPGTGATSGFSGGGWLRIQGANSIAFFKTMLAQARHINSNTTGSGYVVHCSGVARTTSVISSITLAIAAGNFENGTTINLYGKT